MSQRQPGSPLAKSVQSLVEAADAKVQTIPLNHGPALLEDDTVLLVDIREARELEREGTIPGAFRAPRGMLEFWVDPDSPYYKPALDCGKTLILFCGGAWRSALAAAALQEMGMPVAHLEGGFSGWKRAGHPVQPFQPNRPTS